MITVVDYGAGNLGSVLRALHAVGLETRTSSDPDEVRRASKLVFPGVGHAASAMSRLRESGLGQALTEADKAGTPILGICLGSQIILDQSEEGADCLGLMPGVVQDFSPVVGDVKVPHIGWNEVQFSGDHPVLRGVGESGYFYFVHRYFTVPENPAHALGTASYGGIEFCCAVGRDNLIATQFHPEKSGGAGLKLLAGFGDFKG